MQMMKIIPGKIIAQKIISDIKKKIEQEGLSPILKIYFIGDDPESSKYIEKKVEQGKSVGIKVLVDKFPDNIGIASLSDIMIKDSIDSNISGMIVQLPVKNPEIKELFKLIPVSKDVDGLNPLSLGLLWNDDEYVLVPATAKAIIKTLEYVASELKFKLIEYLEGKNCLIINRSLIVGKPVASILLRNNATLIIAHSKTRNIEDLVSKSQVIISATGIPGFLNKFRFSPNTTIIDSGFKYVDGKILGDAIIDDKFGENVEYLSPVPGGIGPIGVACLLENTLLATKENSSRIQKDLN